jgi:carbonic anhydrase/acetyltransferase-like protein (isoleucine patch superfamily)
VSAPRSVLEARDQDVTIASSATLLGRVRLGRNNLISQGAVIRSIDGRVQLGAGTAVIENSVVIGRPGLETTIGHRSVFGHRCTVIGATVGDLCEIGNGSTLMPGAHLGNRIFLGERTLVPAGVRIPDNAVAVGNPARVVRTATADDIARLTRLRDGDLSLPSDTNLLDYAGHQEVGPTMGQLYAYRDKTPTVAPTAYVFDSAEITGDVVVGAGSIIGAGVKIIGDSHGPVRIGERVQILENSVLHLLPDNELIVEDDVVIGPAAMIHGCHLGARTVVEPAATVCDWAKVGADSIVRAGAVAKQVDTVTGSPERPAWAFQLGDLDTLARIQ